MADYATLAELKTQLGISDTVDDTPLGAALSAASRAVDEHCGRKFSQDASVVQRLFYPAPTSVLYVDDISTATGVIVSTWDEQIDAYVDEFTEGYEGDTLEVGSDYVLAPPNAEADGQPFTHLIATVGTWPTHNRRPAVRITAQFGWKTVPPQVKTATLIKAARLFRRKDTPEGVAGTGEFGVIRLSKDDVDVKALLAPFVRVDTAVGFGIG